MLGRGCQCMVLGKSTSSVGMCAAACSIVVEQVGHTTRVWGSQSIELQIKFWLTVLSNFSTQMHIELWQAILS